jgi:hypothetical protein
VASFGTELKYRGIAEGPAPIEGQGAPVRALLSAGVSGGDVTRRDGHGIMVCNEERALIVPVCAFGDRTKHALVEGLAASLPGRSNYRLERP